jgi:hypothetical protein
MRGALLFLLLVLVVVTQILLSFYTQKQAEDHEERKEGGKDEYSETFLRERVIARGVEILRKGRDEGVHGENREERGRGGGRGGGG